MGRFSRTLTGALLALAGVAGAALAATFTPSVTTPVSAHVREYEWMVSPETAPVGTVAFDVHNDGQFVHDVSILGRTPPPLNTGESATLTVVFTQLGPYTYNSTRADVEREMRGVFTVTGTALTTTATTTTVPPPDLPLRHVADVPLPGGSSRFDYQTFDPRRKRLYIAHLGADAVTVFDVARRRVAADVVGSMGVHGVHGVLAVPALGRVYATSTEARQLAGIRDLSVATRTLAGSFPDGLAYDTVRKRVFVSDKTGGAEVVVDRRSRVVGKVPLGGEAGNVKYDAGASACSSPWPGASSSRPSTPRGSASSPERPSPAAHGLQLLSLDTSLYRLYVAAESGVVAVFEKRAGPSEARSGAPRPTAHSVAVDPPTHLVYFPLESVGGGSVLRIMAAVRSVTGSR